MAKANDVINLKGLTEQEALWLFLHLYQNHSKIWTAEREALNCSI